MSSPAAEYRPRHPQDSDYYHCVEDYFDALMQVYDDNFSRDYGFWRPYIEKVIYACPSGYQGRVAVGIEMENLARYIIRASFSQERMKYLAQEGTDDIIPGILEPVENNKAFRKNWSRLIQKIYEVDPLICPKCKATMRIIRFIEDTQIIRAILMHLGLWLVRSRPPPKIHDPPNIEYATADLQIQPHTDIIYGDPEYSWDDYIYPDHLEVTRGHKQS